MIIEPIQAQMNTPMMRKPKVVEVVVERGESIPRLSSQTELIGY